jgi:hypothetical protein
MSEVGVEQHGDGGAGPEDEAEQHPADGVDVGASRKLDPARRPSRGRSLLDFLHR